MASLADNLCIAHRINPDGTTYFDVLHNNMGYYKIDAVTKEKTLVGIIMIRSKRDYNDVVASVRNVRYDTTPDNEYTPITKFKHPSLMKVQNKSSQNEACHVIKQIGEEVELIFVNPSFYTNLSVFILNSTNKFDFKWSDASIDGRKMAVQSAVINPGRYTTMHVGGRDSLFGLTDTILASQERFVFFGFKSHEATPAPTVDSKTNKSVDLNQYLWEPLLKMPDVPIDPEKMRSSLKIAYDNSNKVKLRHALSNHLGKGIVLKFDNGTKDFCSVSPDYYDNVMYTGLLKVREQASALSKPEREEALRERIKDIERLHGDKNEGYHIETFIPCGHSSPMVRTGKVNGNYWDGQLFSVFTDITADNNSPLFYMHLNTCTICSDYFTGVKFDVVEDKELEEQEKPDDEKVETELTTALQSTKIEEEEDAKATVFRYDEFIGMQLSAHESNVATYICSPGRYIGGKDYPEEKMAVEIFLLPDIKNADQFVIKFKVNKVLTTVRGTTEEQFKECLKTKDFSPIIVNMHDIEMLSSRAGDLLQAAQEIVYQKPSYLRGSTFNGMSNEFCLYTPLYYYHVEKAVKSTTTALIKEQPEQLNVFDSKIESEWPKYKQYLPPVSTNVLTYDKKEEENEQVSSSSSSSSFSELPAPLFEDGPKLAANSVVGISCDYVTLWYFSRPVNTDTGDAKELQDAL
jgi:hypothetical protein